MHSSTHLKGRIGLTKVIADLTEKGFLVCLPVSEHSPFDLLVFKEGTVFSVQVRYRKLQKSGVILVAFNSSWSNSSGSHNKAMDKSIIDVVAVYCPNTSCCYYLDPNDFGDQVSLRVDGTGIIKCKQLRSFTLAEYFVDFTSDGPASLQEVQRLMDIRIDAFEKRRAAKKVSDQKTVHEKSLSRECLVCGTPFTISRPTSKLCYSCGSKYARKNNSRSRIPVTKEKLAKFVWDMPLTHLATKFDVSDTTVAKWCARLDIDRPPRGWFSRKS